MQERDDGCDFCRIDQELAAVGGDLFALIG